MTTLELQLYQSVPSVEFNTYWIPCTWFINLLKEARKTHRISDAQGLKLIMEVRMNSMRSSFDFLAQRLKWQFTSVEREILSPAMGIILYKHL